MNNTLSVEEAAILKDTAIITLMEDYAKYLFKKGKVTDVETAKVMGAKVISAAMDNGHATSNTMNHFVEWLTKKFVNHDACKYSSTKFLDHVFGEEIFEVLTITSDDQPTAEFRAAIEQLRAARRVYKDLLANVCNVYGVVTEQYTRTFLDTYKNLFDAEFYAMMSQTLSAPATLG